MNEINMKAVLRQTGLTADCLRSWEKRYGAVKPARSESGRRVYRDLEVQRLKLLAELVRQGHAIGKIANLADEKLVELLGNARHARVGHDEELSSLMAGLRSFDLAEVRLALSRLRYSVSPREFAFNIVPEVMFLIGKKIEDGTISIAQEHALSEILQGYMKRIYEDLLPLDGIKDSQFSLVFCTRDGDPHDFGLMMSAIACRSQGLKTHYVGKSLPIPPLLDAVQKITPRVVVLGLSSLPPEEEKITPQEYLKELDLGLPEDIEIWIGGSGTRTIKKPKNKRSVFIFEKIEDLEEKIRVLVPS